LDDLSQEKDHRTRSFDTSAVVNIGETNDCKTRDVDNFGSFCWKLTIILFFLAGSGWTHKQGFNLTRKSKPYGKQ
jgi:hypothetical protein